MCGRYTQLMPWSELVELYRLTAGAAPAPNLPPRYNICPTQQVPVVRADAGGRAGRELVMMRWGLVPSWSKDAAIGSRLINTRAETVAEKPSFRSAYRSRRCLIPADGYYEWRKQGDGPKQPYLITLAGGASFAFAGLWERWEKAPDGKALQTCTIITTAANTFLRPIHHRMPVILDATGRDAWLGAATPPDTVSILLAPYGGVMEAQAIGTRVNNPRNDDAACIEPPGPTA
ncbi:MAG: SOS response-associated peptidase [Rhodospirillales bacterium]|nr:SOS response-associated peptidase [Rhodospirillales bacterium]HJO73141.1 SOS response-associated peptidase [Rhodospirillales bacterium]